jgi:hypothetical protein
MSCPMSWVLRRGSVYRFRRAVPTRLRGIIGKREVVRTLNTKDAAEAKRVGVAFAAEVARLFSEAEAGAQEPRRSRLQGRPGARRGSRATPPHGRGGRGRVSRTDRHAGEAGRRTHATGGGRARDPRGDAGTSSSQRGRRQRQPAALHPLRPLASGATATAEDVAGVVHGPPTFRAGHRWGHPRAEGHQGSRPGVQTDAREDARARSWRVALTASIQKQLNAVKSSYRGLSAKVTWT